MFRFFYKAVFVVLLFASVLLWTGFIATQQKNTSGQRSICDEMSAFTSGRWGPCKGKGLKCGSSGMDIEFDCPSGIVAIYVNNAGQLRFTKGSLPPVERRRLQGDVNRFINQVYSRMNKYGQPVLSTPWYMADYNRLVTIGHQFSTSPRKAMVWLLGMLLLVFYIAFGMGMFGFGEWHRDDIPVVWLVILALLLRIFLAPWQIHDLTLYVPQYHGQIATIFHSYTSSWYRLFQSLFVSLAGASDKGWFFFNALASGFTIPPFYLVIRKLTDSRKAALSAAFLLTLSPNIVRYAPTDCHHNLLLLHLFWGMALMLTSRTKSIFAGIILLGFAAFLRPEGVVFVLAAFVVMDRRWLAQVKAHQWILISLVLLLLFLPLDLLSIKSKIGVSLVKQKSNKWLTFMTPGFAFSLLQGILPLKDTYMPVWRFSFSGLLIRILIGFGLFAGLPSLRLTARRLFVAGMVAAAPVYLLCEPYTAIYAADSIPAIAFMTGVAGIGLYDVAQRIKPGTQPLLVALAILVGGVILMENLGWIRKHLCFQTEYSILVAHKKLLHGRCVLLTWNKRDQDLGLYRYPELDIHGCKVVNCFGRACRIPDPSSMPVFYFRDTSCLIRWTGPSHYKNAPGVSGPLPACAAFERRLLLKPIDVRKVNIDITRYVIPRTGRIGLFKVTGLSPKYLTKFGSRSPQAAHLLHHCTNNLGLRR